MLTLGNLFYQRANFIQQKYLPKTSDTNTNFYFDVAPDQLEASLDRFAQFFIAPLILESSSTRELEAVNSEYFKNVDNDDWRLHQISKTISDPDHDYSKFNIGNIFCCDIFYLLFKHFLGNLETLRDVPSSQGINTREALLKFHDQWYSSNLMSLCVLGKGLFITLFYYLLKIIFYRVH